MQEYMHLAIQHVQLATRRLLVTPIATKLRNQRQMFKDKTNVLDPELLLATMSVFPIPKKFQTKTSTLI